jgi:IclR family KDG regulon transcriptional repressor
MAAENKLKSLQKALDILESFSVDRRELGVSELSKILGINTTSVFRILNTLKSRGYLEQTRAKGKYRLGTKVFELVYVYQSQFGLIEAATPNMEKLGRITNETINLAILSNDRKDIVYIAEIDSNEVLKTDVRIGTRLPAHCTGLGKAMLSRLSEDEFERIFSGKGPLITLTEKSISRLEDLEKDLRKIREKGYAMDDEEFKIGVRCIAAPIVDLSDRAVAAISIMGPAVRLSPEGIEKYIDALLETAQRISRSIGSGSS